MTPEELAKTYVFNNTEVRCTGRTADRQVTKTPRRTAGKEPTTSVTTLYEVTPTDQLNGSWKKWVRMAELFEIKQ